jgi:hypothetical protein
MPIPTDKFIAQHFWDGKRHVAGRVQAAIVLIESLRERPQLILEEHQTKKGKAGLISHETLGKAAHKRLGLIPINKNHGRRSSNLPEWGQPLLEEFRDAKFLHLQPKDREALINEAQSRLADKLRAILNEEPLKVRIKGRSAEAVIADVLAQADEKGKAGDVAQYLVAAKLELRFGRDIDLHGVNKRDRKSRADSNARLGDFPFGDAVIEVAVGLPDEKHLEQVSEILEDADKEVWLLTRCNRVATWKNELENELDKTRSEKSRVVVRSVEGFIGQNVAEMGEFSAKGKAEKLAALFNRYNIRWVKRFGPPGIRITDPKGIDY